MKNFSQIFGKIALCGVVGSERKIRGFGKLPNKQNAGHFRKWVPTSYACCETYHITNQRKENEIEEIKVFAVPPEKEVVLGEDEVEKIIPLLQNLKTSKPGYKIPALAGQTVRITVQKTDGTIIEIFNVGNVQIIINNRSYRADYESAEAINNFVNKVLETGY